MSNHISSQSASARESARHEDGKFGTQLRDEVSMDLGGERPYAHLEPVDIDSALYEIYIEHGREMASYSQNMQSVTKAVARHAGARNGWVSREDVEKRMEELRADDAAYRAGNGDPIHPNDSTYLRSYDRALEHRENAEALEDDMRGYDAEFDARGGWTRAFLVSNANGHVHSSMDCSTCFRTGFDQAGNWREGTRYHWVTEMSGQTEEEVVDAAGERACTVCYPSAPVETLNKPTTLFTPEEVEKAKAREEREAAKIEREKVRIEKGLTEDGSPFKVDVGGRYPEQFKTEQAATTWVVDKVMYDRAFEYYAMNDGVRNGVEQVKAAIATKHGWTSKELDEHLEKKIVAKAKREKIDLTTRAPRGY